MFSPGSEAFHKAAQHSGASCSIVRIVNYYCYPTCTANPSNMVIPSLIYPPSDEIPPTCESSSVSTKTMGLGNQYRPKAARRKLNNKATVCGDWAGIFYLSCNKYLTETTCKTSSLSDASTTSLSI
jgi:hypothetical protein